MVGLKRAARDWKRVEAGGWFTRLKDGSKWKVVSLDDYDL